MKYDRVRRRLFLQGLGGSVLALPFMPSLLPKEAVAQTGAVVKRFFAIKSYSAQNIIDWYPSSPVSGYSVRDYGGDGGANGKDDGTLVLNERLSESSGRHSNNQEYFGHYAPLSDFSDGISRILGPELNPFAPKMLLLRGLDFMPDTNHNDGGMLGHYGGGSISDQADNIETWPTIDQALAESSKFYPTTPAARSLHLSPGRSNTFSFTADGDQVIADTNPKTAFDRLFGNFQPPGEEPQVDPNLKIVDRIYEDYLAARESSRMSAEDRQTMERHLGFLSELQDRLQGGGSMTSCSPPDAPPSVSANGTDVGDIQLAFELMIDVGVAAMQCDLTRIVTLDVYKAIGKAGGNDQGFEHSCASCEGNPNPTDWHRAAHDWDQLDQREKVVTINEWIARNVMLRVLERLDVEEANGQTYLDNSVVFWGNELGMNHLNYSVPVLLAGSAGGYLATGRYIDYIDWDRNVKFSQHNGMVIEGVPYNRLMVTLLQAMGLSPEDYEREPGQGFGEIRTLGKSADAFAVDYDLSQIGAVLPGIRA